MVDLAAGGWWIFSQFRVNQRRLYSQTTQDPSSIFTRFQMWIYGVWASLQPTIPSKIPQKNTVMHSHFTYNSKYSMNFTQLKHLSNLFNKLLVSKLFQSFSFSVLVIKWWRRRCQQCWQTNYICLWNNEPHSNTTLRSMYRVYAPLPTFSSFNSCWVYFWCHQNHQLWKKNNIFGKWYGCEKSVGNRSRFADCWFTVTRNLWLMVLFWNRMCSWNHRLW